MRRLLTVFACLLGFCARAETWADLQQSEAALMDQYHRLRNDQLTAATVSQRLRHIGPVAARYDDADERWDTFQMAYDRFSRDKTHWLVQRYHRAARNLASADAVDSGLGDLADQLDRHAATLEDAANRNANDAEVYESARRFTNALVLFWDRAVTDRRGPLHWVGHHWERARRAAWTIVQYGALTPEFYAGWSRLHDDLPVTHAVAPALARALRWLGYRQTLENAASLDAPIPGNTVRVLAPNLAHGFLDAAAAAQLPLDRARIFTAPDLWAGPWLAQLLAHNRQFVCAGSSDTGAIQRTLRDLGNHECDTLFHQPQGSLSTGLAFEIRRPSPNFVRTLLALRHRGYAVEVVPISLTGYDRLLGDLLGRGRQPRELRMAIHEALEPRVVELLLGSENPQRLSRLLRQFWFDAAHDASPQGVMGSPRLESLVGLLDRALLNRTQCPAAVLQAALAP